MSRLIFGFLWNRYRAQVLIPESCQMTAAPAKNNSCYQQPNVAPYRIYIQYGAIALAVWGLLSMLIASKYLERTNGLPEDWGYYAFWFGVVGWLLIFAVENAYYLGRSGCSILRVARQHRKAQDCELAGELEAALRHDEFELHYQPQYSNLTKGVIGFEALIRWNHPVEGMISPAKFIPLAESNGMIVRIGHWSIREACSQVASWRAHFDRDYTVAVNLSAAQFADGDLISVVRSALESNSLHGSALELEITESLMMRDPVAANFVITDLKAMGVKISMDDFGTGYSSLAYITNFDIDAIKIDQSFVRDMQTNSKNRDIIRMVIGMGDSLGCHVIAEGVETREQFEMLKRMRCHSVQGYLLSKPIRAADTMTFLATTHSCAVEQAPFAQPALSPA